jgi:pilus assembly protein Flp/PilA
MSYMNGEVDMKDKLMNFLRDEEGATAIEYGLIAGLIAVVIIGAVGGIGDELDKLFVRIKDALSGAGTPGTTQGP